jgi:LysM repeat protein
VVQDDDTLPAIAARFHVTVNALLLVNHLSDPGAIHSGQVLLIPAVYRPHTNPAAYAHPIFYTIQPGDSLYSIAQLFNTTPAALSEFNHINNQALIRVGDGLVIP